MIKITKITVDDVRFPTSEDLTGSDAIHTRTAIADRNRGFYDGAW